MKLRKPILMAMLYDPMPAANAVTIPAGSHATVRLNTSLSSATAHTGEVWSGTLTHEIVEHGKVVVRAGAPVKGKVTYVNRSGRLHKPGALTLRLSSINGETVYSSAVSRKGKSHTKGNAEKIGGGAGAGAVIGALAGGGKGAAIGAASRSRRGNRSCRRYRQGRSQNSSRERSYLYDYRIEIISGSKRSCEKLHHHRSF